jgi:hypothetical protein
MTSYYVKKNSKKKIPITYFNATECTSAGREIFVRFIVAEGFGFVC